jgi:dienelactone hydrolase
MVHIVFFHSILGPRPAEREIATAFEADGHTVALPDLYGGRTANGWDEGFRLSEEIGQEAISARARAALAVAPEDAVLAGVSFGAFLIGRLWGERPHMAGALLLAGPPPWMEPRRPGLPISAHIGRIQTVVATRVLLTSRNHSSSASAGVFQPSVFLGLALRAAATAAISSALCALKSVPFGKY